MLQTHHPLHTMKLLTLACVLGSAAAFVAPAFKAPATRSVESRVKMMAGEKVSPGLCVRV